MVGIDKNLCRREAKIKQRTIFGRKKSIYLLCKFIQQLGHGIRKSPFVKVNVAI